MEPEPEQLVDAIRRPSPSYKGEAIDAILAHHPRTLPPLIAFVDEIAADPDGYLDSGQRFGVVYALALLTQLGDPAAHDAIVRLARLPNHFMNVLLDYIAEGLDLALLATAGDRTDGLITLLRDRNANEFARSAAAEALVMLVHRQLADRDEVLPVLVDLLRHGEDQANEHGLWGGLTLSMLELQPREHAGVLRQACRSGLIDPSIIEWEDIERALVEGELWEVDRRARERARFDDFEIHTWFRRWTFEDPEPAQQAREDKPAKKARKKRRKR